MLAKPDIDGFSDRPSNSYITEQEMKTMVKVLW